MIFKNPIHEVIYREVVKPELNRKKSSTKGWVLKVNDKNNTVMVQWKDPLSSVEKEYDNVTYPVQGDGVFGQSIEVGDEVTISFRNGEESLPYVSSIHKKKSTSSNFSKYGAGIPKGIGFL